MILIAASQKDLASLNISQQILKHRSFRQSTETFQGSPVYISEINKKTIRLVTLQDESIRAQNLPEQIQNIELVIFISRHRSVSGKPTLSVHTPGNLGKAELGGTPRTVSIAPAKAMREALKAMVELKEEMQLCYEVSYEGTHHGPSLNVPTMFAEVGSSPEQWADLKAAEVVARATIDTILKATTSEAKAVIGIGGPHYSNKFTRIAMERELAFGHIIPKYAVPLVDAEILKQCVRRTLEKVEAIMLDWKGIKGEDKSPLAKVLSDSGISYQKV